MAFQRRILHHGDDPGNPPQLLSLRAVRACWFELHRQGGCGAGEVVLADAFELRSLIEIGDWIRCEAEAGQPWYLGRVEERISESPARVRLRLQGMGIELNEMFPGGFGLELDGRKPHRYAATDLFDQDPDRLAETFDPVASADGLVRKLMEQYGSGGHVLVPPEQIETPALPAPVESLKLRGEESLRAIIKDLAVRAQSASWGVDAEGRFFFLRPRGTVQATFREARDLVSLAETRDAELLFNRILLTGDYLYDRRDHSDDQARRAFRWRGNYFEPISREQYGDRRIRLWLPWIRTQSDAVAFAREFFRTYSQPVSRFLLETTGVASLPAPWAGRVRLEDRSGAELITARIETVRVLFDHVPRLRMELGPESPRDLWPEPTWDERWEVGELPGALGGPVTYPGDLSEDAGPGGSSFVSPATSSAVSFPTSADVTSSQATSSEATSEQATSESLASSEEDSTLLSSTGWDSTGLFSWGPSLSGSTSSAAETSGVTSSAASSNAASSSGAISGSTSEESGSTWGTDTSSDAWEESSSGSTSLPDWGSASGETSSSGEGETSSGFDSDSGSSWYGPGGDSSSSSTESGSGEAGSSSVSSSGDSSGGEVSTEESSSLSDEDSESSPGTDSEIKSSDSSSSSASSSMVLSGLDTNETTSADETSSEGSSSEGITFVWS